MRVVWFWIVRYGPAEIAGTLLLLAFALPFQFAAASIAAVTVAGIVGENLGFYGVMIATTAREVSRATPHGSFREIAGRSVALTAAEFGPSEVLDSLLTRPVAVAGSLLLFGNTPIALGIGKVGADLVFYAIAAGAFVATKRLGWRKRRVVS
ncbi:hypothetical protein [Microbacterium sp.]|uniref:hypothetical protein n=1 Tax=Microbacterium sp. TaxID=51671 RepID=UPI003C7135AB